jgi:hypothetical protein
MFAEMLETSSQNTWIIGLMLYFLSTYLSSYTSKEIQKADKCQSMHICGDKCTGAQGRKEHPHSNNCFLPL